MTPRRLTLYQEHRAGVGTVLAALPADARPTAAGYIIDILDPVGVVLATAMRERFGKPDFARFLGPALADVRSQVLGIGLVQPRDLAALATDVAAAIAKHDRMQRHKAVFVALARELSRTRPPDCFQVVIVGDGGADVDVVPMIAALNWQNEPINPASRRPPSGALH
jgi:hypothetical protein